MENIIAWLLFLTLIGFIICIILKMFKDTFKNVDVIKEKYQHQTKENIRVKKENLKKSKKAPVQYAQNTSKPTTNSKKAVQRQKNSPVAKKYKEQYNTYKSYKDYKKHNNISR